MSDTNNIKIKNILPGAFVSECSSSSKEHNELLRVLAVIQSDNPKYILTTKEGFVKICSGDKIKLRAIQITKDFIDASGNEVAIDELGTN